MMVCSLFAEDRLKLDYLSTNIPLLETNVYAVVFGNLKYGTEVHLRGFYSFNEMSSSDINEMSSTDNYVSLAYTVSLTRFYNKVILGSIDKYSFISAGITENHSHNSLTYYLYYDNKNSNVTSQLSLGLSYGMKFLYNINKQAGIEIHLPYISYASNIFDRDNHGYKVNLFNNPNIRLRFTF